MRRTLTTLALTAVLVLAPGCTGDDDEPGAGDGSPSATPTPSADAPVTLERREVRDPAAPPEVVLTSTSDRRARYLLTVTPPGLVGIDPEQVELAPDEETVLRVVGRPAPEPVTVRVIDAGSGEEVATLEVPPAASPTPAGG